MKTKNKNWLIAIVAIVIIALILVIATHATKKSEPQKIKVGFITGITGTTSYLGVPNSKAVFLAEKKLKEIYGEEAVQIIVEDSKSDSKEAANAANKLINVDNVDAIFVEFTGPSGAVVPIAKDNDIAVLYSAYTTDPLTKYEYSLKTYRNAEAECTIYAKIAKSKGIEKIAVLDGAGGTNGIDCQRGALNYYTPENVKIENLAGVQDIKTVILKLSNEGYNGLFSYLYENTTLPVITAKLDYGLDNMILFGDAANTYTDKIKETVGANNLDGTITSILKYSDTFTNDYYLEYGNVDGITANAPTDYDGIIKLYSAVKKCGKENKDCIVDAMLNDKLTSTVINYGPSIGRALNPQIEYHIIENGEPVLLNIE
ncbi:MAG TPA: ABC transporter substrate-binding protein [Candidatus Diapherotrites archaeon]|nr:ABC transporter substrate-binding protein [Candidatus Diapherotrites archaeon]